MSQWFVEWTTIEKGYTGTVLVHPGTTKPLTFKTKTVAEKAAEEEIEESNMPVRCRARKLKSDEEVYFDGRFTRIRKKTNGEI